MNLAPDALWRNGRFLRLFSAECIGLIGGALSTVALGLFAHHLVKASTSEALGVTLTIRIAVIVLCAPWAGFVADFLGSRLTMIACDLTRAAVVAGLFFVDSIWDIYVLAALLNLGSAIFTPVYKAVIPGITTDVQYPRALALSAVASDTANIFGPSLAAFTVALIGFWGNFVTDALTFVASAALIFGLPRMALAREDGGARISLTHGLAAMFGRRLLRESFFLALQVSVAGGFIVVATINFTKSQLALSDAAYALAMSCYGVGSICGAALYGRCGVRLRRSFVNAAAPAMILALVAAGWLNRFEPLLFAWALAGAGRCVLDIRGNELVAGNTASGERPHVFAAHFALSYAGWGITYPLAGYLVTAAGFDLSAYIFAGLLVAATLPLWMARRRPCLPSG